MKTICFALIVLGLSALNIFFSTASAQEFYVVESAYGAPALTHIVNGVKTSLPIGAPAALPQGIAYDKPSATLFMVDGCNGAAQVRVAGANLSGLDSLHAGDGSMHALYGVAINAVSGRLWWSSSDLANKPVLYSANLDGTDRRKLDILPESYGMTTFRGIAVDDQTNTVYIASDGTGKILRYNAASEQLDTVLSGLASPVGVAVDHASGSIYWTESLPQTGSIHRANLTDGSSSQQLYGSLNTPNYIQVDPVHDMLYWTQLGAGGTDGTVAGARADGGSAMPENFVAGLNEPAGLWVLSNTAYVDLSVMRHCLPFGTVAPEGYAVVPLEVQNPVDTVAALIDSITFDNNAFSVPNGRNLAIPAGGSLQIMVKYSPASAQTDMGGMTIWSGPRQYAVALSGNGMADGGTTGEQFAGVPYTNGSVALPFTEIRALRTDGRLIRATLAAQFGEDVRYHITIFEGDAGIAAGDTIVFVVTAANCDTMTEQTCANAVVFAPAALDGAPAVERNINAFPQHTLSIPLEPGYNAVSWSMVPADPSVAAVFQGPISRGNVKVIFRYVNDGAPNLRFDYYIPALGMYNPMQTTSNTEGYFVNMKDGSGPDRLDVTGLPVCDGTPIYLNSGYNFVSYLAPWTDVPQSALWSLRNENLALALRYVNQAPDAGYFQFYPSGDLGLMSPGEGYFLNVHDRDTLIYYGFGTGASRPAAGHAPANDSRPTRTTNGSVASLPQAVFLYGLHVRMNGDVVPAGTEVTAFDVNGRVCGSGAFAANGVFSMAVMGDDPATEQIEGVRKGESFRVVIGGKEAGRSIVWSAAGDTPVLDGNLLGVDPGNAAPKEFRLDQNYPNPFNPTTTVRFGLPNRSSVRLTVFSVTGQQVAELYNGAHDAGYVSVEWNSGSVASGVYYYRLEAASIDHPEQTFVQVRKMLLLR